MDHEQIPAMEDPEETPSRIPQEENEFPSITEARDFHELYTALDQIGELRGGHKTYSANELKTRIENARKAPIPIYINSITRTGGLRKKVRELLLAGNK
ncbi:MAG: hypothetical protein ABSC29_02275 [Minisyncoccia bacterium]|jgi:hypothetical protein